MAKRAPRHHPQESATQGTVTPEVQIDTGGPSPSPEPSAEAEPEDAGVVTQVVDLSEPKAATRPPQHWANRKLRAEVEQRELLDSFRRNKFPLNVADIERNSHLMLIYALIAEERLTQDEVQARLGEYQLLYLRSEWRNLMQQASQRKPALIRPNQPPSSSGEPVLFRPKLKGKLKVHDPADPDHEPEEGAQPDGSGQ